VLLSAAETDTVRLRRSVIGVEVRKEGREVEVGVGLETLAPLYYTTDLTL
jgi:hypothetical protein